MKKMINKVATAATLISMVAFFGVEGAVNSMDYSTAGALISALFISFVVMVSTAPRYENRSK